MTSIENVVTTLGNVATRQQILFAGFNGTQLAAAVHRGELERIRRGWYATKSATQDQRDAVFVGGRMSHATAARSYALWAGLDSALHVTVTRGASRLRSVDRDYQVHWIAPGKQDLRSPKTWRVSFADCLRGMVAIADIETAVACLDSALHEYKLDERTLAHLFAQEPASSRTVAARARRGSESGLESVFRQRLDKLGLRYTQQVRIRGVGRVDFLLGKKLVIEVDGREFHSPDERFESDRNRLARLVELNYTVLQFSYRQIMFDWAFVERVVLATAKRVG